MSLKSLLGKKKDDEEETTRTSGSTSVLKSMLAGQPTQGGGGGQYGWKEPLPAEVQFEQPPEEQKKSSLLSRMYSGAKDYAKGQYQYAKENKKQAAINVASMPIAGLIKLTKSGSDVLTAGIYNKANEEIDRQEREMDLKIIDKMKQTKDPAKKARLAKALQQPSNRIDVMKEAPSLNKTPLQIMAEAGEASFDVATLGFGSTLLKGGKAGLPAFKLASKTAAKKAALKAAEKQAGKSAARKGAEIAGGGAGLGAVYGTTGALQEGTTDIKEIGKSAVIGSVVGAAAGGALYGAGKLGSKAIQKLIKKKPEIGTAAETGFTTRKIGETTEKKPVSAVEEYVNAKTNKFREKPSEGQRVTIHQDDLNLMRQFTDYVHKVDIPMKDYEFEGAVRNLAEHYGFNPNQTNPRLAKDFESVLDQHWKPDLNHPITTTIKPKENQILAETRTLRDKRGRYAGSESGLPVEKFRTAEPPTTRILKDLEGKTTVSKQYIQDATNRGDLKKSEVEIIRGVLATEGDKVDVTAFTKKVQAELLPLTVKASDSSVKGGDIFNPKNTLGSPKYERYGLPEEQRGNVANYQEKVYESPVATSAGDTHFGGGAGSRGNVPNYFGHTRVEDLADKSLIDEFGDPLDYADMTPKQRALVDSNGGTGDTRRVIEVQSDLYQKGQLEREMQEVTRPGVVSIGANGEQIKTPIKIKDLSKQKEKLKQYNDPTAHFRMIREEVKQAAVDGKTKLQFPTGETAMKIEGLARNDQPWIPTDRISQVDRVFAEGGTDNPLGRISLKPEEIKVGTNIKRMGVFGDWTITDSLGDGKFKAIPNPNGLSLNEVIKQVSDINRLKETFDLSARVDTTNPIYKFYDKDLAKYVKNKYDAKLVTDDKGVSWWQVDIKPEHAGPVEAFRLKDDFKTATGMDISDDQEKQITDLGKKIFGEHVDVKITGQILTPKGQEALGSYREGMIKILGGQADAKDTMYHEAAHAYIDMFTTKNEQIDLLTAAQKSYGIDDIAQVEEKLAEDFINYAKTHEGVIGSLRAHFDNVLQNIRRYFGNEDQIKALYSDIYTGKAKQALTETKSYKEQISLVTEALNAGDKDAAKAIYDGIPKTDYLPKFEDIATNASRQKFNAGLTEKMNAQAIEHQSLTAQREEMDSIFGTETIDNIKRIMNSKVAQNPDFDVSKIKGFDEISQAYRDRKNAPDMSDNEILDIITSTPAQKDINAAKPIDITPVEDLKVIEPPKAEEIIKTNEAGGEVTKVPETQLPVGAGKEKLSRLEARIKGKLDAVSPEDRANLSTYSAMNKEDQIKQAVKFVTDNPKEAMKVLEGKKMPPEGLLNNSVAVAMSELAKETGDADMALKLASFRGTRAGQEVSILSEFDKNNPVKHIDDLVKRRVEAMGGEPKIKIARAKTTGEIKSIIKKSAPTRQNWSEFVESIRC